MTNEKENPEALFACVCRADVTVDQVVEEIPDRLVEPMRRALGAATAPSFDHELKALGLLVHELSELTDDARRRVLGYIEQRFGLDKCGARFGPRGPAPLNRCTLLAGHPGIHVSETGVTDGGL